MAELVGSRIPITALPIELSPEQAIEAIYGPDLDAIEEKLRLNLSVLLECDKQLTIHLYRALRQRLKSGQPPRRCQLISGQQTSSVAQEALPTQSLSLLQRQLQQLQEAVFAGTTDTILVLPHLDILTTTTQSGLGAETREVAALLYESYELVLLAFKDPSFEIPKVLENLFPVHQSLIGIPRDRLPALITQREARKLAHDTFDPYSLYKYLSGVNALRCRQILDRFRNHLDFDPRQPHSTEAIFQEIRQLTLAGNFEMPHVDLENDIGGYAQVKQQLREEILALLSHKDHCVEPDEIRRIEMMIPKGIIFYGPPGTGKTYFAKALATALNAALVVVSGPELKSKWVGESEANLRRVFAQARRAAPAVIVFDELDSFATTRQSFTGSGVEHSMVNQLLTEMDGFRKEELVFVIGTTNLLESLDPALLRPGRFELTIEIPYPDEADRRAIFTIYNNKFQLSLSEELIERVVRLTSTYIDENRRVRFSGDHLNALARALKRDQMRRAQAEPLTVVEVERCIRQLRKVDTRPADLKPAEERTIAIHEAGHAIAAYVLPLVPTIEQLSIATGETEVLGYMMQKVRDHQYVTTRAELLEDLCVLLAGRAAEQLFCGDISMGAFSDLLRATEMAQLMVMEMGMGQDLTPRNFNLTRTSSQPILSEAMARRLDEQIDLLLRQQADRVHELLRQYQAQHERLVALLLEQKTVAGEALVEIFAGQQFKVSHTAT